MAPPRGRGRPSGARDSFVSSAVLVLAEFYLEFNVGAAISLSFDSFSILTEVLEIIFYFNSTFCNKDMLILIWEIMLKLMWVFLS